MHYHLPTGNPLCLVLPLQPGSYISRWRTHRWKKLSSWTSLPGKELPTNEQHQIGFHESKKQTSLFLSH